MPVMFVLLILMLIFVAGVAVGWAVWSNPVRRARRRLPGHGWTDQ